ncbi:unnamed protein product, partial [Nesidiocoris tenuis]
MKALHPLYFIPSTTSPLLHPLAVFTSYPPAWALPRGPFSCKYFSLAPAPSTPSKNPHAGPHYNRHRKQLEVAKCHRLLRSSDPSCVFYGRRASRPRSAENETGVSLPLEIRGKTWLVLWWEMNRWMQRKLFGSVLNMRIHEKSMNTQRRYSPWCFVKWLFLFFGPRRGSLFSFVCYTLDPSYNRLEIIECKCDYTRLFEDR